MTRRLILPLALMALPLSLGGCGLHPLYGDGGRGSVASALQGVEVGPIEGKAGWLMTNALNDRLARPAGGTARYRLEIKLDDNIAGLGVRADDSVARERRTLRARYQLIDAGKGTILLDATAGSDAGIDVVNSEYATIAAENTALERLSGIVADQIVARVALYCNVSRTRQRREQDAVKANAGQIRAAIDAASPDIRLFLLHGPDEAGARELAARLARRMGPEAERIDIEPGTLRGDPGRLADEAAALSLFGGARFIRVVGADENVLAAATLLLEAERAGNPVLMIAPGVKSSGKLVKLATDSRAALAYACYVPQGREAGELAAMLGREAGLRLAPALAQRVADAAGGDRAVMASEIEKLALYLDAAPERPATADIDAYEAIGADVNDAGLARAIDAAIDGDAAALNTELALLRVDATSGIPMLRQLAGRLIMLADMQARIADGAQPTQLLERVFFRDRANTGRALTRWRPAMIEAGVDIARTAERAIVSSRNAGHPLAEQAFIQVARLAARVR